MLHLTPRQVEVCILAGCFGVALSDKAIARELGISVYTVQDHMRDAAERIRGAHPNIGDGSPRRVCQAWMRRAYHAMASNSVTRRAA